MAIRLFCMRKGVVVHQVPICVGGWAHDCQACLLQALCAVTERNHPTWRVSGDESLGSCKPVAGGLSKCFHILQWAQVWCVPTAIDSSSNGGNLVVSARNRGWRLSCNPNPHEHAIQILWAAESALPCKTEQAHDDLLTDQTDRMNKYQAFEAVQDQAEPAGLCICGQSPGANASVHQSKHLLRASTGSAYRQLTGKGQQDRGCRQGMALPHTCGPLMTGGQSNHSNQSIIGSINKAIKQSILD